MVQARRDDDRRHVGLRGWPARVAQRAWLWTGLVIGVSASLAPAMLVAAPGRVALLKIGVATTLTMLPGWLYAVYLDRRGDSLYDEFVLNLIRLRIDDIANLPMPPQHTTHYLAWKPAHLRLRTRYRRVAAVEAALDRLASMGPTQDPPTPVDLPTDNLYRQRFEGVYGRAAVSTRTAFDASRVSRVETFSPVVLATLLIGVGWVLTLQPELLHDVGLLRAVELSGGPVVPVAALQYAFAGSYAFIVLDLVRRSFVVDLRTTAYVSAVSRIVTVALIVAVLHAGQDAFTPTELAVAFSLGFFPRAALDALQARTVRPLARRLQGRRESRKLGELDGMDIWQETRLLELGIENMQQLATADLVEILLRNRAPVERIVHWLDRAMLLLLLDADAKQRASEAARLRTLGIRYATDLVDAHASGSATDRDAIASAMGLRRQGLRTAVASLRRQRNYGHVRAFRSATVADRPADLEPLDLVPTAADEVAAAA